MNLKTLIQNNCTLQEFEKEFFNINKTQNFIQQSLGRMDRDFLKNDLMFEIIKNNRQDVLNFVWNEGCFFNLFKSINSKISIESFFDIASKEMQDFILQKCNNIKLLNDIEKIYEMDVNSILYVNARELREFLGVKSFTDKNRDKLEKLCNEKHLKYACIKPSPTFEEHYFYGRFVNRQKRESAENYEAFKKHFDCGDKQEFINELTKSYVKMFNKIKFTNSPIYSKDTVLFVDKDFNVNKLSNILQLQK